ncbi:MAG: shikimate kinase [Pseudarcicella sp.]|nr:shikimate kinase [Pseudarcicella sp.]
MVKNIYLIGMPSSGKSSLGRLLADEINYNFLDLDTAIEQYVHMSVPDIFKNYGEEYFRKVETVVLTKIEPNQSLVIATGGGTPCFFDNMDFILANGVSVFLNVSPQDLAERIQAGQVVHRPLIDLSLNKPDLKAQMTEKLAQRIAFYQRANVQIDGNLTVDDILTKLDSVLV